MEALPDAEDLLRRRNAIEQRSVPSPHADPHLGDESVAVELSESCPRHDSRTRDGMAFIFPKTTTHYELPRYKRGGWLHARGTLRSHVSELHTTYLLPQEHLAATILDSRGFGATQSPIRGKVATASFYYSGVSAWIDLIAAPFLRGQGTQLTLSTQGSTCE